MKYSRGEFYRYVESESGLTLDYDAIKEGVFAVLFGRNSQTGAVDRVLDREFPTLSPATVNRELRHLKAVLRIANEWGYLPAVPKVRMLKEPKKLPRYVRPEHFASIYKACDVARRPAGFGFSLADYWRGLLTFCYLTGWRISEPLALRWDDVSLDKGQALTRFGDNKAGRDDIAPLHPVLVSHLRKLVDGAIGQPMVFPWPHHERTL